MVLTHNKLLGCTHDVGLTANKQVVYTPDMGLTDNKQLVCAAWTAERIPTINRVRPNLGWLS